MLLQKVVDGLKQKVGEDCGLAAIIKFDFGDQGKVVLDATQIPNLVSTSDSESDCTMVISIENFMALADGTLDGASAFMSGRLKIQGDMGIAMKLGAILS